MPRQPGSRPLGTPSPARSGAALLAPDRAWARLRGSRALQAKTIEPSASASPASGEPSLISLLLAVLAMGVAAGFLELLVYSIQVHVLHKVDESSLRISRHVVWMIPVAEVLVTVPLALVLVGPAYAWSRWRRARGLGVRPRMWRWMGLVLGTLLVLGPCLAVRGLYPAAVWVLALGFGFRVRRWLVQPTPGWSRWAVRSGLLASVVFPAFTIGHWYRITHAGELAVAPPRAEAPNLLWIVMDTVRADRTSLHGHDRPTTPELERWSRQGITFDEARSAASWTLPSHVTMFTGLWPSEHGARVDRPYLGAAPTVAEYLRAQGYHTAGFVANTGMCNACYGVGRGFEPYVEFAFNHEVRLDLILWNSALGNRALKYARKLGVPVSLDFLYPMRRIAPVITQRARDWLLLIEPPADATLSPTGRPFFLFLNFMDAHSPYIPRPDLPRVFSADRPVPSRQEAVPATGWKALQAFQAAAPEHAPALQRDYEEAQRLLADLYDDCIRGLDHEIGRFLDELRDTGRLRNTWVIVTSDHGEYLGERGLFGHGSGLHNAVTHVPLLIIPPLGQATDPLSPRDASVRGRRVDLPVSLRDLPATMAELLDPGSVHPFPGHSLADHWEPDRHQIPRPFLAQLEQQPLQGDEVQAEQVRTIHAIFDEGHVLIETPAGPPELYHLERDRAQNDNLAHQPAEQDRIERLRRTKRSLLKPSGPR